MAIGGLAVAVSLLAASGLRGLGRLAAQLWFTRRLMRRLSWRRLPLPTSLASQAGALQLAGRVTLVDDVDAYAFAAGLYATPATFTPHRVAPLH